MWKSFAVPYVKSSWITFRTQNVRCAPKADIERHDWHVRFVPKADITELTDQRISPTRHLCVCLKYLKSGGGWSFLAGINKPSALRK